MTKERNSKKTEEESIGGMSGLLQGLGGFLDMVSSFADKDEARRSGEWTKESKGMKAVYGFSVRMGGGEKPRIEPFGNVVKKGARGPAVDDEREPMIDIFDEDSHIVVVVELPGVEESDIKFTVDGDDLSLTARRGERKYSKEIQLPCVVTAKGAVAAYRNGVFELKLTKDAP